MSDELETAAGHKSPLASSVSVSEPGTKTAEGAGKTPGASIGAPERPSIASAPLSVILVARPRITEPIAVEWTTYLDGLGRDYEALLVQTDNAGATDDVNQWAARFPRMRLLHSGNQRGFGAALRLGLEHARHPLLFYTLCDEQYPPADLDRMLQWIDHADVVGGYRLGGYVRRPRILRRWAYRKLIRLLFAVRMRDLNCYSLLARRSIFARIPIQSDTSFAHVEVLAKANFLGCLMTEVPVSSRAYLPGGMASEKSDLLRVFSHPSFGPARVPSEPDLLNDAPTTAMT